jgi:2-methylisocitrate lyase-like PEP mutase family enzyme
LASFSSSLHNHATQNETTKAFKALHKPGDPLVLINIRDAITAKTIASIPGTKALATAIYAIVTAAGVPDDELTPNINLHRQHYRGRSGRTQTYR